MPNLTATQSAEGGLSGLARIHLAAKRERSLQFDNLLHHITPALLEQAYFKLNRKPTRGIDGVSWGEYGRDLTNKLQSLHQRLHTQDYKPQPVLRTWIPKLNGEPNAKKMTAKLKEIKQELMKRRAYDVYEVGKWLNRVIQGHNNYYAVPGNSAALNQFRTSIRRSWLRALRRRGQRHPINWQRLSKLLKLFIPQSKIIHPYPNQRLSV